MLEEDGFFVLDYLNATQVKKNYKPAEKGEFQDVEYDIKRYLSDNSIVKEITFSGDKVGGTKQYSERVKLYELTWFRQELQQRGFEIMHVYGDYEGHDFDPETSSRLLIISRLQEK